jgi:hypothetical protein
MELGCMEIVSSSSLVTRRNYRGPPHNRAAVDAEGERATLTEFIFGPLLAKARSLAICSPSPACDRLRGDPSGARRHRWTPHESR